MTGETGMKRRCVIVGGAGIRDYQAIWNSRKPEQEDTCSMCGKFCAVRSMNKALNGEYIDIL